MESNDSRSAWYDQTLPNAEETAPSKKAKRKHRKKRTGLKITAISLSVLILLVASAYIFSESFGFRLRNPAAESNQSGESKPADDESGADAEEKTPSGNGYQEYFDSYFTEPTTTAPCNIEPIHYETDFRLEPQSTEGLEKLTLQELYTRCAPSVVSITAASLTNYSSASWGTGFVVSADGIIITNQHIIAGRDLIYVGMADGSSYEAGLIGENIQTDIAVLKIAARNLTPLPIGDSSAMQVGDEVVAIGNPLGSGLTNTLTNGILSAINRDMSYEGHSTPLLQTTAALNEGNSGGPLFNMYGQVIGITSMKLSSNYSSITIEGLGFAIPSATVKAVTDQLIESGSYVRPGMGITIGSISQAMAESLELPEGLYIQSVSEGSNAEQAGVRVGDVLTHVNGISVHAYADVLAIRDACAVGDEMTLTLYRDGETFDLVIVLQDLSLLY